MYYIKKSALQRYNKHLELKQNENIKQLDTKKINRLTSQSGGLHLH